MQFHNRKLTTPSQKYDYNAWDNEQLTPQQKAQALLKIKNDESQFHIQRKINHQFNWNEFYKMHSSFFKNRKWIFQEFEDTLMGKRIFEIGCGTGSSLFWFFEINKEFERTKKEKDFLNDFDKNLEQNDLEKNNDFFESFLNKNNFQITAFHTDKQKHTFENEILPFEISGCDLSAEAVEMCQKKYDGVFFVFDMSVEIGTEEKKITAQNSNLKNSNLKNSNLKNSNLKNSNLKNSIPLQLNHYNTLLLIFTLSAIHPSNHKTTIKNAHTLLQKNGKLFFKDYGHLDMVQIRMKENAFLEKNFYQRNDGTCVYFFDEEYFRNLVDEYFCVESVRMDRRLLVNRKRGVEMYRVFLQAVLVKK